MCWLWIGKYNYQVWRQHWLVVDRQVQISGVEAILVGCG